MQLKCQINNFQNCIGFGYCEDFARDFNVPAGRLSCHYETLCKNQREQDIENKQVEEYYKNKKLKRSVE